jgi:hypothetical protein
VRRRRGSRRGTLERATEEDELPVLWPWTENWTEVHEQTARAVADLPVYRLRVGETPDESLPLLDGLFDELQAP